MSNTAAAIIEEKGASIIADRLNIDGTVVRMWKSRNKIPRTAWPDLIEAFPDLTLERLREAEAA